MVNYGIESSSPSNKKIPYPKSVFFIIGNEFCERFSYYGMKAILVIYFRFILEYSEDRATQAYHIFSMACFFTPVLGAFIADSLLGKFWTILTISIVYAIGNIVLSLAAIKGTVALTFLGLGFIALGTGGIKPCVAAFGGDQFRPEQGKELQRFFSLFYISINGGSLISTFLTPILRQDVSCGGRSDCYPLAFGVPAALMVVALSLFVLGRFVTEYTMVPPQKENVLVMVVKCSYHALSRKLFSSAPKKQHWLEYSDDRYDAKTINDVKALMSILFLYIPLPIFWSLFDQQGSRWTLQAIRMNGQLGSFIIKPDQIQVINPVLIILVIPVFQYGVYPLLKKINLDRPLQRMTIGGVLAGVSFLICFLMQLKIEQEQPVSQLTGHNHLAVVNGLDCDVRLLNQSITPFGTHLWPNKERAFLATFNQTFHVSNTNKSKSSCIEGVYRIEQHFALTKDQSLILFISEKLYQHSIDSATYGNILVKPDDGGALLFTIFSLKNYHNNTFASTLNNNKKLTPKIQFQENLTTFGQLDPFEVEIIGQDVVMSLDKQSQKYDLDQGATYIQLITGDIAGKINFHTTQIVDKNQMSVFWQLVQYFVIVCAEIMFSITGLEFSYSQAPKSMKSVLQAAWLITIAFGNLIIAIIADSQIFPHQSYEFLFFGTIMIVDMAIFAVMAKFYVPFKGMDNDELAEEKTKDGQ